MGESEGLWRVEEGKEGDDVPPEALESEGALEELVEGSACCSCCCCCCCSCSASGCCTSSFSSLSAIFDDLRGKEESGGSGCMMVVSRQKSWSSRLGMWACDAVRWEFSAKT